MRTDVFPIGGLVYFLSNSFYCFSLFGKSLQMVLRKDMVL